MKIKTKDWGPGFKGLSDLMALRSMATTDLQSRLVQEVAAADGSHSYGRHGAQTGWEAQLVRAVTQVLPHQPSDPMGLNATIRRWNFSFSYSDTDGSTVFDLFGNEGNPPDTFNKAAGPAGAFYSPEAQMLGRARGMGAIHLLNGPQTYCAHYLFKTGPKFIRAAMNTIHVVVGPRGPGGFYGIGFNRQEPQNYPRYTVDFVRRLIEAQGKQESWSDIYKSLGKTKADVTPQVHKFNMILLAWNKPAFPSIGELAQYFDVDISIQKNCSLIFRRTHFEQSGTHSGWRLVTMFPDTKEVGWAPDLYLGEAMKQKLVQNKMNKNADDYHWTGVVSNKAGTMKKTWPVPNW